MEKKNNIIPTYSSATDNIRHASSFPRVLKFSQSCPKIMAYGSDKLLTVNGYFSTNLEYKGKMAHANMSSIVTRRQRIFSVQTLQKLWG